MIQVRCEGCQATFELDERRIPKNGMRVRCPKCGASFHVSPTGQTSPAVAAAPKPAVPLPTPSLSPAPDAGLGFGELDFGIPDAADEAALPAPVSSRALVDLPAPAAPRGLTDLPTPSVAKKPGLVDLPRPAPPRPAASSAAKPGLIDLPANVVRVAPPGLPKPAPPPALDDDPLLDLPANASAASRGVTDLPAPVRGITDLPVAAQPVIAPPRVALPKPPPARRAIDAPAAKLETAPLPMGEEFGELSLPIPAQAPSRAPAAAGKLDFDSLDEPAIGGARAVAPAVTPPAMTTDALDDPFGRGGGGGADLPSVARGADLPATKEGGTDLPAPAKRALGRVALEKRAVPVATFQGALEEDLPVAATGIGLPKTAAAPLPSVVARGDLPKASPFQDMPRVKPATASEPAFGELDLPVVDPGDAGPGGGDLDFDLAPPSAQNAPSLPPLKKPSGEFDLTLDAPAPVSLATVDAPTRGKPGVDDGSRGIRGRAGGTGYGEVDLGGDEPVAPAMGGHPGAAGSAEGGEFDDIRLENPKHAEIGTVGGVVPAVVPDLDVVAPPRVEAQRAPRVRDARPSVAPSKRSPRRGLFIALGVVGTLVIGGAALSLTSAGPFGATLIDEQINGASRRAAAQQTIANAARLLEGDTWGQARRALGALDSQLARTPNEPTLLAYDTYAHYLALARFGNDPGVAGPARTLYDQMNLRARTAPAAAAARAARDLVTGHADRVHVSPTDATTRDLATLAALLGSDPQAALEIARAASENHATSRARFLYARALFVADDLASARQQAEALLTAQPEHAGAKLLLARVLSARADGRDRAVGLAHDVEQLNGEASTSERTEAAVLIGQIELARGHVTPAREAYERALALDPRSADALVGTGRILYRTSDYNEALARFQAAQTADPDGLDSKVGYAMTCLALGRAADARSTLEPLLPDHGSDPNVHYWLARSFLALTRPADAEREFREAIRLDNTNLDAYTTLAALLFSQQRPEAAEQVLEEARAHVSDQAAIHRALGEQRAVRGDLTGAEAELRQAVAAHTDDTRSHFLLGQVLRRGGHFDDAARELDTVARIDADYPGLSLERGTLAENRGDAAGALQMFRMALSRDPQNADLTVRVAAALLATGQYGDVDTQMTRFVADHPTVAEAQYVLGRAKLAQGDVATALRLLERATELDATRADFQAYAAEVNLQQASYSTALRHANTAIQLDARYARGYQVRGEIEARQGQVREALVDANRALQLEPSMAEAMVTLADADEGLAHPAEAIILYRRALTAQPNRGEWHARLGRLLADQGHGSEAVGELERATSLGDPQNPPPTWLAFAHRQLGDALRESVPSRARTHYQRFLDLSPTNATGAAEVRAALAELSR